MYAYRQMTPAQREQVLAERKLLRVPWHAPAHFGDAPNTYLLTAACWDHQHILATTERRTEWESKLIALMDSVPDATLLAWAVMPNHYHLLMRVELQALRAKLGRLHNGASTQWNREDKTPGRKVWFRFTDRAIRSERHQVAALNYIHGNPVKHKLVARSTEWPWSSLSEYEQVHGLDQLRRWWHDYPVGQMGEGWDDEAL